MKLSNRCDVDKRLILLRKRCPWVASLIQHCLDTRNPKSCETMRTLLLRLRLNAMKQLSEESWWLRKLGRNRPMRLRHISHNTAMMAQNTTVRM